MDVKLVDYELCQRLRHEVIWPSDVIEPVLQRAKRENWSIILVHSHPEGTWDFSSKDDESDLDVIPDLQDELSGHNVYTGTAICLENGAIKARVYDKDCQPHLLQHVVVAGDEISIFKPDAVNFRSMAFTTGMRDELADLSACVIGVSGTGSIVAEQLARLGFGRITLIDPDRIESKNLNRILNSRICDADQGRLKTDRFKEAIMGYRSDVVVDVLNKSIEERDAVLLAVESDILFSCVDSATGRQFVDLIASAFVMPLFDVGVTIPTARSDRGIEVADVVGRIDYIQPGGSSLYDRGVYTQEQLRGEELANVDPSRYTEELREGYIDGVHEEAPSVITLNMRAASGLVNEFIARAYPYRFEPNCGYARTEFSLAAMEEEYRPENAWKAKSTVHLLGRGASEPLLGIPSLGQREQAEVI